jgi:hypothetical protein
LIYQSKKTGTWSYSHWHVYGQGYKNVYLFLTKMFFQIEDEAIGIKIQKAVGSSSMQ